MAQSKLDSLKFRLSVLEYLAAIKREHSYLELEPVLGMKPSVLSRYVKGRVIPTEERARAILEALARAYPLERVFLESITSEAGMVDNSRLVGNTPVLKMAATQAAAIFLERKVDKVLTMASDGIPYATLVADVLGARLAIAKKEREKGVRRFVNSEVPVGDSGFVVSAYLPADILKKGERCLIVDDIVRSGETQQALTLLAKKAGCQIAGYSFLIAISERWRDFLSGEHVHIVSKVEV